MKKSLIPAALVVILEAGFIFSAFTISWIW